MENFREFIIPAIDIKDGKLVRLKGGDFSKIKEYSDNPAEMAEVFHDRGFKRLHVVDLDGAKEGKPVNISVIKEIRNRFPGKIQLGGGLRDVNILKIYKEEGIDFFIIGTVALTDKVTFKKMVYAFPESIILAIDSKKGRVAVHGWTKTSELKPEDVIYEYDSMPIWGYLYTIVERDGMLKGIDPKPYENIRRTTNKPIIASGGVSSFEDIRKLHGIVDFVVVGKALYEGLIEV